MVKATSLLCFVLMISMIVLAVAQDQEKESEGRGFFIIGQQNLALDELNTALTAQGYNELKSGFFTMGGVGYGIVNRVLLGGEGQALFGDEVVSRGFKMSLSGGYGLFNLGYLVKKTERLNVYPFLGIGGGGMTLEIIEQGAPSFEELLENPRRSSVVTRGGVMMDFGLGADYLITLSEKKGETGGMALGFRAGYNWMPWTGDWIFSESEIAGGPEIRISGAYIKFMIGGGGRKLE
ncbi:hypothetical protein JW992_11865 [candidate division KSB1 bacterium]|nr:hypothetical protein [candidate division KSB1 bacterium]